MKKTIAKIDRLIKQLTLLGDDKTINGCRLYVKRNASFAIAIAGNGKKFVVNTDGRYHGFHGFDGCLLDKYNVAVYTLADYMVMMRLLTEEEARSFCRYAEESSRKAHEQHKIQEAERLLQSNGYQVQKVRSR